MNEKQSYFLPVIISLVFVSILVFIISSQQSQINSLTSRLITPTPTSILPSPTPTPDPTSTWKTYKNNQYGFEFKYPEEIFVYQGKPQKDSQYWSNKINGTSPFELDEKGVWMNFSVTNLDSAGYDFYKDNVSTSSWIVVDDMPTAYSETAYSYSATRLVGKKLYRLSIGAFSDENLLQYKETISQILSTFKFTN